MATKPKRAQKPRQYQSGVRARLSITILEREILRAGLLHLGEFYESSYFYSTGPYRVSDLVKRLDNL